MGKVGIPVFRAIKGNNYLLLLFGKGMGRFAAGIAVKESGFAFQKVFIQEAVDMPGRASDLNGSIGLGNMSFRKFFNRFVFSVLFHR